MIKLLRQAYSHSVHKQEPKTSLRGVVRVQRAGEAVPSGLAWQQCLAFPPKKRGLPFAKRVMDNVPLDAYHCTDQ